MLGSYLRAHGMVAVEGREGRVGEIGTVVWINRVAWHGVAWRDVM